MPHCWQQHYRLGCSAALLAVAVPPGEQRRAAGSSSTTWRQWQYRLVAVAPGGSSSTAPLTNLLAVVVPPGGSSSTAPLTNLLAVAVPPGGSSSTAPLTNLLAVVVPPGSSSTALLTNAPHRHQRQHCLDGHPTPGVATLHPPLATLHRGLGWGSQRPLIGGPPLRTLHARCRRRPHPQPAHLALAHAPPANMHLRDVLLGKVPCLHVLLHLVAQRHAALLKLLRACKPGQCVCGGAVA